MDLKNLNITVDYQEENTPIKIEELYKLSYYGINSKVGSQTILSFVADFIDPKYIKDDNYLENGESKYNANLDEYETDFDDLYDDDFIF